MKYYFNLILLVQMITSCAAWGAFHEKTHLNQIQIENRKSGTLDWQITNPATDREIEGYASLTSVNRGDSISFFVSTIDDQYIIDIFRLGWYGGKGGRRMMAPIERDGVQQVMPTPDDQTGLIECDWEDPFTLSIPAAGNKWISGAYVAKLTAKQSEKESYILFFVRDDARASNFLFQSSVTTFQAYNNWGGKSLYDYNSTDDQRAFKVSFNRPYALGFNPESANGIGAGDFITNLQPTGVTSASGWEYNMVRFLEKEGYDVSYATDVDTHANPDLLQFHRAFLSVGHDEYWSKEMRDHVEAARDRGVHLAFFSSNTSYWQIRFEPSSLNQDEDRTIICYKSIELDPIKDSRSTVLWRSEIVNRPEDQMIGVMYANNPTNVDLVVELPSHWVFENTGLEKGDHLVGLVGYEVNRIFSSPPEGITLLAHSPYRIGRVRGCSDMTIYTAQSGALVFATGSLQWSWGLDNYGAPELRPAVASKAARQMTRNVLNRMQESSSVHRRRS